MDYQNFIQRIKELGFMKSQERADAAIKAVLGILASSMRDEQAREMTRQFPSQISYDKLRGHQKRVALMIPVSEYIEEIARQFDISEDDALRLIDTVMHSAKTFLSGKTIEDMKAVLPIDWADLIERA